MGNRRGIPLQEPADLVAADPGVLPYPLQKRAVNDFRHRFLPKGKDESVIGAVVPGDDVIFQRLHHNACIFGKKQLFPFKIQPDAPGQDKENLIGCVAMLVIDLPGAIRCLDHGRFCSAHQAVPLFKAAAFFAYYTFPFVDLQERKCFFPKRILKFLFFLYKIKTESNRK